jgi:hypothetical protein
LIGAAPGARGINRSGGNLRDSQQLEAMGQGQKHLAEPWL